MVVTNKAIVLSSVKYADNDLIVKCYTQHYGVLSFLLRGVLKSKKGLKTRNEGINPHLLVEFVCSLVLC